MLSSGVRGRTCASLWSECKCFYGILYSCLTPFSEEQLLFLIPPNLPSTILSATQAVLAPANLPPPPAVPSPVKWTSVSPAASSSDAPILTVSMPASSGTPKHLAWHKRGDYLATVCTSEFSHIRSLRTADRTVHSVSQRAERAKVVCGYTSFRGGIHRHRSRKSRVRYSWFCSTRRSHTSLSRSVIDPSMQHVLF